MIEVGSFEAKNRLSEFLQLAEAGQRVFITRRGKRVAVLIGAGDAAASVNNELESADLLRRFRQLRRGVREETR
jgi:prevent-host-death family protein